MTWNRLSTTSNCMRRRHIRICIFCPLLTLTHDHAGTLRGTCHLLAKLTSRARLQRENSESFLYLTGRTDLTVSDDPASRCVCMCMTAAESHFLM